jgi:hypothetical protein
MLRRFLLTIATLLTIAAPLAVVTAPAEAATTSASASASTCATRAGFSRVRVGQSVATTQAILGSKGKVSMAGSFMSQRQWRVCGSAYSWVTLTYVQGRLDNKILL